MTDDTAVLNETELADTIMSLEINSLRNSSNESNYELFNGSATQPSCLTSKTVDLKDGYVVYRIVVDIFLVSIVCLFGFIGNGLTILVLHRDQDKKNTTNCLLQALAVSDLLYLLACVFIQVLKALHDFTDWCPMLREGFPYMEPYIWGFASTAATITVWLVILVTADRYIAVCLPLQQNLRTIERARLAIIVAVALGLLYNIPRFFERVTVFKYDACINTTIAVVNKTVFRQSDLYILIYKTIMYFIFRAFGPLITLLVLNFKLIKAFNELRRKRLELKKRTRQGENITFMLIVVVTVFIICLLPDLTLRILLTLHSHNIAKMNILFLRYANAISNLLLTVNSSINFLIYCLIGNKFRKLLNQMCCGEQPQSEHSIIEGSETETVKLRSTVTESSKNGAVTHMQKLPLLNNDNIKDVSL